MTSYLRLLVTICYKGKGGGRSGGGPLACIWGLPEKTQDGGPSKRVVGGAFVAPPLVVFLFFFFFIFIYF